MLIFRVPTDMEKHFAHFFKISFQVYYKAMRDIEPAEEMLLYGRDAVKQLESLQSSVQGISYDYFCIMSTHYTKKEIPYSS